jgi:hypothetical protein
VSKKKDPNENKGKESKFLKRDPTVPDPEVVMKTPKPKPKKKAAKKTSRNPHSQY